MSFVDLVAVISGLVSIATGAATAIVACLDYFHKHGRNTQALTKFLVITFGTIFALTAVIALGLIVSRPTIAVNHQTGISLPGHPAPTEANNTTVVVITPPVTPAPSLKKLEFNKKLTCLTPCYDNVDVVLNNVVIDQSHDNMTWNFTVTNNGSNVCSAMYGNIHLEDPNARQFNPSGGTLTEPNPINTGQTLQENVIFSFIPQPGVSYTLHTSMYCNTGDDYQIETFTF
jgi:hypothetical protein